MTGERTGGMTGGSSGERTGGMTEVLETLEEIVDPAGCALLVVDVQNDFVHPEGWSARHGPAASGHDPAASGHGPAASGHGAAASRREAVISPINRLIRAARGARVAVAYLCMEHGPEVDAPNYRARYEARGMADDLLCERGTWGARLHEELLAPRPEDLVVVRHSYDGFTGTGLDDRLRDRGVRAIVACGVVTDLCVRTTAEHAFALGYYVVIPEDATAAAEEDAHRRALRHLGRYFATVVPSGAVAERWEGAASADRSEANHGHGGDAVSSGPGAS